MPLPPVPRPARHAAVDASRHRKHRRREPHFPNHPLLVFSCARGKGHSSFPKTPLTQRLWPPPWAPPLPRPERVAGDGELFESPLSLIGRDSNGFRFVISDHRGHPSSALATTRGQVRERRAATLHRRRASIRRRPLLLVFCFGLCQVDDEKCEGLCAVWDWN